MEFKVDKNAKIIEKVISVPECRKKRNFTMSAQGSVYLCADGWGTIDWLLFIYIISHIDTIADVDNENAIIKVIIPLSEICKKLKIQRQNAKRDIMAAADNLHKGRIYILDRDKDGNFSMQNKKAIASLFSVSFLQEMYDPQIGKNRNYFIICMNPIANQFIFHLRNNFFSENMDKMLEFRSPYAIKMFMIAQYMMKKEKTDKPIFRTYKEENLRYMLCARENYKRWAQLKHWVVEKAIKELAQKTDIEVQYEDISETRGDKAIKLRFAKKKNEGVTNELPPPKPEDEKELNIIEIQNAMQDDELIAMCYKKGIKKKQVCNFADKYGYALFKSIMTTFSAYGYREIIRILKDEEKVNSLKKNMRQTGSAKKEDEQTELMFA